MADTVAGECVESVENVEAHKCSAIAVDGARPNGLHRRELERLCSESRRVAAQRYHPEDHDCLALTGPMT